MSPPAILERLSEALRGKDGKLPEIFHLLADSKGSKTGTQTWLAIAKAALSKGDKEQCKGILEAYLEQDPNNSAATLLLSKACQQMGNSEALDESVAVARLAVDHASTAVDSLNASAQLAVSLGTRARVHTRQQMQRRSDRAEAIELLASLDALASPSSSGEAPHGLYTLALLQAEQGDAQAAMAAARSALQAAQAARNGQLTALCLVLVAALMSARRQHKLALSVLSAAPTSSSPSDGSSGGGPRGPLWSDVLVGRLRARLLAAQADAAGAMAALAQCKKLLCGWLEGRTVLPAGVSKAAAEGALVQVWCELALALASSGQKPEAMAAIDHALALQPWAATSRHALGAVYEALGQYDEAAASYNDALALDPTHAPSLLRQGALNARRGTRPDLAVARDMLTEALRYDPACAAAWYQLGRVAASLEHRAEAEGYLLTAVQLATTAPALEFCELPLAPLTGA